MTPDEEYELLMKWEKMDDWDAYWDYKREMMKSYYHWFKEGNPLEDFRFIGKKLGEL